MRWFLIMIMVIPYLAGAQVSQVKLLAEAESLLANRDTTAALELFSKTLNAFPDSYPAALRLTEVYYQQGIYREAIQYSFVTEDILMRYIDSVRSKPSLTDQEVKRARRYERDLADIRMLKGKIRLKQNRPVDALHELRQALTDSEKPEEVLLDIGLANVSLGEYQEAKNAFQQTLSLDPGNKGALFNLGNLYYTLKEYDSARVYYEQTHAQYPNLKWPLMYLGNIYTVERKFAEAIPYYSAYIKLDSMSEEAYFKRAVLYSELRQWDEAIADWNKTLAINENLHEAWKNRGLAHFQQKDYDKALADFSKSIELQPESYTYINRGYTHYLLGNFQEALNDLDKGLEELSEYPLGYYFRALSKSRLKDKEGACEDLSRALKQGLKKEEVLDKKLRKLCF
jgi:tetratricopeptide (TPR) repeat protein